MTNTRTIAAFIAQTRYADIPVAAVERVKVALLDHVGVMLAGSLQPASAIAAALVREEASASVATLIGHGFRASVKNAAYVNGMSGHALDFDQSYTFMGQPMSGLTAAVLALCDARALDGRRLIEAYAIGHELTAKIACCAPMHGEEGGWHAVGTLGTLGCTAAACRLLELGIEETAMALGIAGSMASGLVRNYGTMGKPLHAGLAARNGVEAALLAAKGFTASTSMLDVPTGFFDSFARSISVDAAPLGRLCSPWDLESGGVSIKPYPCGGLMHSAIDAALALRREHAPRAEDIERIDVDTAPFVVRRIVYKIPRTELEAKFSMPYAVARAVIDGEVRLEAFNDHAIVDPDVLRLADRVHMAVDPSTADYPTGVYPSRVSLRMKDGRTLTQRVVHARGTPEAPMTAGELREKFTACAGLTLSDAAVTEAVRLLEDIERLESIAPLCAILAGSGLT